jgi:flagellar basal-body rod protein FlgF
MDSGFYAACAGLRARSQALEIVANNLANLNTTGYRAHETTFRSLLARNASANSNALNRAVNDFGVLGGTRVDLHAGNLESTGNALNFALEGDGFFTIQHQGQTFYTRDGNFRVSPAGQLITSEGDFVLGEQGPISVPSGQAAMGADGTLSEEILEFGEVAGEHAVETGLIHAEGTVVGHVDAQ